MTALPVRLEALERPKRIQLSRAKGWRMPPNTVKVDRSTPFGNPYAVVRRFGRWAIYDRRYDILFRDEYIDRVQALRVAVTFFRAGECTKGDLLARIRTDLRGKDLGCWCKLGDPCHASDVLLELANPPMPRIYGW